MKYEVWYHKESLSDDFDDPIEYVHKRMTPLEAQEMIGASKGKCNFILLPSGKLSLRVYDVGLNGYQYFNLPSEFYAVGVKEEKAV